MPTTTYTCPGCFAVVTVDAPDGIVVGATVASTPRPLVDVLEEAGLLGALVVAPSPNPNAGEKPAPEAP